MKKKTQPTPAPVSIDVGGKTYSGTYTTERGTITVSTGMGRSTAQIGSTPAASVARILLRQLVDAGKA